jgi:hypothetical protein
MESVELGLVDRTIDRTPVDVFLTGGLFDNELVVR